MKNGKKTVHDYRREFEGKKFVNKRGFVYEVLKIKNRRDCVIYFPDTGYTSSVYIENLKNNAVSERFVDTIKMNIGDVFGELTAIEFKGASGVVCSCSCGNTCENTRSNLFHRKKTSCGCKPTSYLYDKFWSRFNDLVEKWNPTTHKESVKKLPIFKFRKGSTDLEKIIAFTYVDKEFYEAWKGYPFTIHKGYVSIAANIHTYTKMTGNTLRGSSHKRVKYKLHHMVRGHVNFGNYIVDHINSLPLDNRFSNLRTATSLENSRNSQKVKGNHSSIYKGVCFNKSVKVSKKGSYKPWQATLRIGTRSYVRKMSTEIDAALAYNELAKEHYGEFAKLNIIKLEND